MAKRVVREDGTVEIQPNSGPDQQQQQQQPQQQQGQQQQGQGQQQQQGQGQQQQQQTRIHPVTRVEIDPSQNITHFQKLEAAGSDEEKNIKFDTEEKLRKYEADVRTINNLQVEDPFRYQAEHGIFPRRGVTDIAKRGLSTQDQLDVIAGKKTLEVADEAKGTYRAV